MAFLQYCHSDVTASALSYDALMQGGRTATDAIAIFHNLLATCKEVQRSPLVLHLVDFFLRESARKARFFGVAWCVKRLRTLQHLNAETAALYQRAIIMVQDMLPLVSAYNTSSEVHGILRGQHGRDILASRVLEAMDKELHTLIVHRGALSDAQQTMLTAIVVFMHRCMSVVNGILTFLQPSSTSGALINSLASHMILLHDKVPAGRDVVYLTVMEGLCSHASDATVELLFQHFLRLFVSEFPTAGDMQVTYLQGVLLRILRNSFAHRRHTLRAFIMTHDSLGDIACCIHNHSGVSVTRHTASLCVLAEIITLMSDTNTRSFDLVLQTVLVQLDSLRESTLASIYHRKACVLVQLDSLRESTLASIYHHIILLLLGKRTARIANDLASELVRVLTSRLLPLESAQVLDALDSLATNHRMTLPHGSCQAIFAFGLHEIISDHVPVQVWVRCLKLLRTFIHHLNQANMISILEHMGKLVHMIEGAYLRARIVSQVLYIMRYVVCRLMMHKDMVRDRLHSLGVTQHILKFLHQAAPRPTSTDNRILEHAYVRTLDLLLLYDMVPRSHAVPFAEHCARLVVRYERNAKMVTDVLRILLRTAVRYKIVGESSFDIVKHIVEGVAQIRVGECLNTVKIRLNVLYMLYQELGGTCLCASTAPCAQHHAAYQICCRMYDFSRHAFLLLEHSTPGALISHADFLRLAASCLVFTVEGKHSPYWEERALKQMRDHCVEISQALRADHVAGSEVVAGCLRAVRKLYDFSHSYLKRVGW